MARTISLADLRTLAYRKTDLENAAARFPTSEVNGYLNTGVAEFVDSVVRSGGTHYYEAPFIFYCDGQNTVYPLPQDFYQLMHIQANVAKSAGTTGDINFTLRSFTFAERSALSSQCPGPYGVPTGYMLHGGTVAQALTTQGTAPITQYAIELLPLPSSSLQILLYYIPVTPKLTNDSDLFDGINGWEEYPATKAAILMRLKDDLPTDVLQGELAAMRDRIAGLAPHRDRSGPARITDVRNDNWGWWGRRRRWGV